MASNNMSPLRSFLNSIKNSVYNISIDGIGNTDINAGSLFNGFSNLYRVITLNDMNYITDMYSMFNSAKNLSQIPNYNFNTSNVTHMGIMFRNCNGLTTVPNFDTSNVTNMYAMFDNCGNLTNVPNFNTFKVTSMYSMFSYCNNLTNIPNFNTSNVTTMDHMFSYCNKLTNIPNFNTSNVTKMSQMFIGCRNLTTIPNFNITNVTTMIEMFSGCRKLINIPNFNTINVTRVDGMFQYCYNLTSIPNFNTSKVINMAEMFSQCNNLTNTSNFDTSNVTNMYGMFYYCRNLIDIPLFNISKVTNMKDSFYYCNNLSQASVNNIVASCSTATKVTNKNWTNIGFNVAEGSKWNTWIRTAPDYMNAVNIGWQNIGDAISPAYKRRIMVGDNLTGKNIYFEPYDLNEFGNYCRNTYYNRADNMMDIIYLSIDEYFDDIVYQDIYTFTKENSSYCIDIPSKISNLTNTKLYDYSNQGASISTNVFKINNNINIIVENITHRFPYDNNAPVGDETSYRAFYIEDENIRPLENCDVIGPGTKFYFTFPDNIFELYVNNQSNNLSVMPLAPPVGEPIIKSNDIDIFTIGNIAEQIIYFGTTLNGYQIFFSMGEIINESIYTVNLTDDLPESNGNLLPITEYNNFDFWSKYILVDTRTLYRNIKIGDNLKNKTLYFTLPDDIYTSDNFDWAYSCNDESIDLYFTYYATKFTSHEKVIAYTYPDWNHNDLLICYYDEEVNNWSSYSQPHLYFYEEPNVTSNIKLWKTISNQDLIVTSINETSDFYKNIFIKEQEDEYTLEEQALNLARLYYFNVNRPASANFSVATTRGEDVFVIQVTKNAAVQMWLTVNTTLGVVLEGSSNPTNEDYALALAEKYYKENYGNDTVYYGVATQKSETEFVIQVTQNAAVLMFLNVNVSTGEVTER